MSFGTLALIQFTKFLFVFVLLYRTSYEENKDKLYGELGTAIDNYLRNCLKPEIKRVSKELWDSEDPIKELRGLLTCVWVYTYCNLRQLYVFVVGAVVFFSWFMPLQFILWYLVCYSLHLVFIYSFLYVLLLTLTSLKFQNKSLQELAAEKLSRFGELTKIDLWANFFEPLIPILQQFYPFKSYTEVEMQLFILKVVFYVYLLGQRIIYFYVIFGLLEFFVGLAFTYMYPELAEAVIDYINLHP
jgi:hypothetical protein